MKTRVSLKKIKGTVQRDGFGWKWYKGLPYREKCGDFAADFAHPLSWGSYILTVQTCAGHLLDGRTYLLGLGHTGRLLHMEFSDGPGRSNYDV
jgi:hypothetical protein